MTGNYEYGTTANGYVIFDKEGNRVSPYDLVKALNEDSALALNEGSQLETDFSALLSEQFETFKRKNASYGTNNIAKFGLMGVLVRASDKLERLINLIDKENPLLDETLEDTWSDLAVYACIAILLLKGKWPT